MSGQLDLEYIFSLPDDLIKYILDLNGQPNRDFYLDRYVVTILLANKGILNRQDHICAGKPNFMESYINELSKEHLNIADRFSSLRKKYNCQIRNWSDESVLCDDWIKCSKIVTLANGWDVFEVPPGTILYKGVNIYDEDKNITNKPMWFATLQQANMYAFSSDNTTGEFGKVVTFKVKTQLYLLNMESINNYNKIYSEGLAAGLPPSYEDGSNVLNYAFGYGTDPNNKNYLRRNSFPGFDKELANWICNKKLDKISGWAYSKLPGFHEEIMICDATNNLVKLPIEYRFSNSYNKAIIKTYNGNIVDLLPINKDTIGSGHVKWRFSNIHYKDDDDPSDNWIGVPLSNELLQKYNNFR